MITRAGRLRIQIEHEHDFGPVLVYPYRAPALVCTAAAVAPPGN